MGQLYSIDCYYKNDTTYVSASSLWSQAIYFILDEMNYTHFL